MAGGENAKRFANKQTQRMLKLIHRAWRVSGGQHAKWGRDGIMEGTETRTSSLNKMQQRKGELVSD